MDLHEQRARDIARAESRKNVFAGAQKTQGILSEYVSSRQTAQTPGPPVTRILWGRVILALVALALLVYGVVAAVR